jgi:murein DD-endopeptidase MepM/ murein hydrolase activator NlpD
MARDERRMTFVVVPHGGSGDLSTRSYEISYRRLRMAVIAGAVALALVFLMAASWIWVAAQAAQVPSLQRQVGELQKERQERERLARSLARMQATYEQIRVMLKGDLPPLDSIEARTNAAGGHMGGDSSAPPPDTTATDTMAADSGKAGPQAFAAPHAWPLADVAFVTRGPVPLPGGHPGLDIAVAAGSRILASGEGTVLVAGEDSVYGRFVVIDHGAGVESVYGHASRLLVHPREHVAAEQVIALSGSTGVSTAPHLHFEIREHGRPVDPRRFVADPEADGETRTAALGRRGS